MIALTASAHHHRPCASHSTIHGYEAWVRAHARAGRIPQQAKPAMWRLEACQADGQPARLTAIRWRMRYLRGQAFDQTHPWSTALASWYIAAGGPIACGGDSYAPGVASRTLPCGTRVQVCYQRCVAAIVFDYGPAAWTGRSMDLSQDVANATGMNGVATVRWRAMP